MIRGVFREGQEQVDVPKHGHLRPQDPWGIVAAALEQTCAV